MGDENCRSLSVLTDSTEQSAPVNFDMSNRVNLLIRRQTMDIPVVFTNAHTSLFYRLNYLVESKIFNRTLRMSIMYHC